MSPETLPSLKTEPIWVWELPLLSETWETSKPGPSMVALMSRLPEQGNCRGTVLLWPGGTDSSCKCRMRMPAGGAVPAEADFKATAMEFQLSAMLMERVGLMEAWADCTWN